MQIPGLDIAAAADDLPWRATRDAGIYWLPLHLDETPPDSDAGAEGGKPAKRGAASVLIRMEPGRGYAAHRHVGSEDVLVLAGGYRDAQGTYRAGEHVYYPPGSEHAPCALGDVERPIGPDNPACVLFSVVPEGIELLDR